MVAAQGQFLDEFNNFEFNVLLLRDQLQYQG